MSYSLPIDAWLSVPNTWKPNTITDSQCRKFIFHHIRPVGHKVELAPKSGAHDNETFIIAPGQVSLIIGLVPGFFVCATLAPYSPENAGSRLLLAEYEALHRRDKAKIWHLNTTNFFQGPYEAFNGPNKIDLA
jgi:hypothetical protein